ncbi:MAG: sugar phosphate isomerase/epimerase [Planctomycetes bacterium]|nr:sugar phosphate isomerase/epimerase [Planctomycetota bacterium]
MANIALSCSTSCIPAYNRAEALDAIARAGFAFVDAYSFETESRLHPDVVFADQVVEDLTKYGLALSGLNVSDISIGCNLTGIKMEIEYAESLGIHSVNVKGGQRTDRALNALINSLRILTEFAKAHGIAVNVRNYHGNRVETLDDLQTIFDQVDHPSLGLALDVGQLHTSKIDPVEAIDRFFEKIRVVYIRDQVGARVVPFGKGEIDTVRVLTRLMEKGYKGPIVADPDVRHKDVEDHIAEAHTFLQGILSASS